LSGFGHKGHLSAFAQAAMIGKQADRAGTQTGGRRLGPRLGSTTDGVFCRLV